MYDTYYNYFKDSVNNQQGVYERSYKYNKDDAERYAKKERDELDFVKAWYGNKMNSMEELYKENKTNELNKIEELYEYYNPDKNSLYAL